MHRPARYEVNTQPRTRPDKVKDRIVRERGFEVLRLRSEDVAEFDYRPTACVNTYRMVVIRKHISKEKGDRVLSPEVRYFFYLTNDRTTSASEIVYLANDRCDQEVRHDNREGIADSVSRTLGRRCLSRPTDSPSKDERGT